MTPLFIPDSLVSVYVQLTLAVSSVSSVAQRSLSAVSGSVSRPNLRQTLFSGSKLDSNPDFRACQLVEPSASASEHKTHALDVQDPLPQLRHSRHRTARARQHQQDQRPGPESRTSPTWTRTARHLSQQEESHRNNSQVPGHFLLPGDVTRRTATLSGKP